MDFREVTPIVLGGCARSGTTLLLSILSAHPGVFAFPRETNRLCPTAYQDRPDYDAPLDVAGLAAEFPPGGRHAAWVEKTPKNVRFFRRIRAELGERTRCLHVVRDGRDVALSRHPLDPSRPWVTPARWILDVSAGLACEGEPWLMVVRYENLVLSLAATVARVTAFCGLAPWDCSTWHRDATVRSADSTGDIRPVFASSVGRWRRHPEESARFLAEQGAGELMRRLGYL